MRASTRRAIRAFVCWPLGLGLVVVWQFWPLFDLVGQDEQMENRIYAEISTSSETVVELTPVGSSDVVLLFVVLLGPGLFATHSWWTRRKE